MSINSMLINRGDIWLVNLEPTVGAEIKKTRPAVIISANHIGRLPIKLVAPITDWKDYFEDSIWLIGIDPDLNNGLIKKSAVDVLQIRGIDTQRCVRKLGVLTPSCMDEITAAILTIIEYEIPHL